MTRDLDLLGRFTRENSQDAFTEIVRRHVNLVYSAALRQTRSPQLAEEVSQSVFAGLARDAGKLRPDTILTAWLYQVTRRTAIDVIRKESRRQLREQIAMEMNDMNANASDWNQIEPLLDEAMDALEATDRSAVLLRYFENKSLREVGEALGASEDAAQKRVSRAVERLREFFTKRKVTTGAAGLAVLISANAVQAAPAGLAAMVSSAIIGATKTAGMTMIHKILMAGMAAAAIGTGIHAIHLQSQYGVLEQQQTSRAAEMEQLGREREGAMNRLASLQQENEQLRSNETELLRLRGEVTRLRNRQEPPPKAAALEPASELTSTEETSILLATTFVSVPAENVQALGVSWTASGHGGRTGLLTEQQFKNIIEALEKMSGAELVSTPRVHTANGGESVVSVTESISIEGTNVNLGPSLDVTPYFSTNSSTFDLNINAKITQFSGFRQLADGSSQPDLQTVGITNQVTLSASQSVVLETEMPFRQLLPGSTNIPPRPKRLLVFVTPQVVDARSFPKAQ